jgi:hypothetical protein
LRNVVAKGRQSIRSAKGTPGGRKRVKGTGKEAPEGVGDTVSG